MPEIGDRATGSEIGRNVKAGNYFTFVACPGCGFTRWVALKPNQDGTCRPCLGHKLRGVPKPSLRGDKNPAWRGGRTLMKTGYIRIPIYEDDPCFKMAMGKGKYENRFSYHAWITEHRYVMAKHLERCLEPWEVVHHKNGDKTDNRIENLELLPGKSSRTTHMAFILLQQEVAQLKEQVKALQGRVTLLEAERVIADAPL